MSPKESKDSKIKTRLSLIENTNYQFNITFDIPVADIIVDETAEIGGDGMGPNPSRLLSTAIANCLSASLLFCLRKARVEIKSLDAEITTTIGRDHEGYLRIKAADVSILPKFASNDSNDPKKIERCEKLFEKYCVVTESVRKGIPVTVEIKRDNLT